MITTKRIVSYLLIFAMLFCACTIVSCTDYSKKAESIEAKIKDGIKNEEYYPLGTTYGCKVWMENSSEGARFILLQPFTSSWMYHGEDIEINISDNEDLSYFGDKLFLEYGEAITGIFDFDISNPLWQDGIVYLFSGEIYYLTPKGEKIAINLN